MKTKFYLFQKKSSALIFTLSVILIAISVFMVGFLFVKENFFKQKEKSYIIIPYEMMENPIVVQNNSNNAKEISAKEMISNSQNQYTASNVRCVVHSKIFPFTNTDISGDVAIFDTKNNTISSNGNVTIGRKGFIIQSNNCFLDENKSIMIMLGCDMYYKSSIINTDSTTIYDIKNDKLNINGPCRMCVYD